MDMGASTTQCPCGHGIEWLSLFLGNSWARRGAVVGPGCRLLLVIEQRGQKDSAVFPSKERKTGQPAQIPHSSRLSRFRSTVQRASWQRSDRVLRFSIISRPHRPCCSTHPSALENTNTVPNINTPRPFPVPTHKPSEIQIHMEYPTRMYSRKHFTNTTSGASRCTSLHPRAA